MREPNWSPSQTDPRKYSQLVSRGHIRLSCYKTPDGTFMEKFDGTIVTTAAPQIGRCRTRQRPSAWWSLRTPAGCRTRLSGTLSRNSQTGDLLLTI